MLHETQRTSAPSSVSVSMSTAVWIVMCRLPMMRAPASGFLPAYCVRSAIRPGISCSARRISLRPNSASDRSCTLNGSRPAALAAANGCSFSVTVAMLTLLNCWDVPPVVARQAGPHARQRFRQRVIRVQSRSCVLLNRVVRSRRTAPAPWPSRRAAAGRRGRRRSRRRPAGAGCDRPEKPSQTWPICWR